MPFEGVVVPRSLVVSSIVDSKHHTDELQCMIDQ